MCSRLCTYFWCNSLVLPTLANTCPAFSSFPSVTTCSCLVLMCPATTGLSVILTWTHLTPGPLAACFSHSKTWEIYFPAVDLEPAISAAGWYLNRSPVASDFCFSFVMSGVFEWLTGFWCCRTFKLLHSLSSIIHDRFTHQNIKRVRGANFLWCIYLTCVIWSIPFIWKCILSMHDWPASRFCIMYCFIIWSNICLVFSFSFLFYHIFPLLCSLEQML